MQLHSETLLHLYPYFLTARYAGSGESAHIRNILPWTLSFRLQQRNLCVIEGNTSEKTTYISLRVEPFVDYVC